MPLRRLPSRIPLERFHKGRIDALTDGIFAFSMTLLVLDVRVPLGLGIDSADALMAHLMSLWRQLAIYILSFLVLGNLWRASIAHRPRRERLTSDVLSLWLVYLFFVTMVPFSSGLVGRYGEFQPAVIVYSINMVTLGALVTVIRYLERPQELRSLHKSAGVQLPVFIGTAFLAMLVSCFEPRYAMFPYALNFLARFYIWRYGPGDQDDVEPMPRAGDSARERAAVD